MRLPNLSTADNLTETMLRLDRRRMELENQVSNGQKITLPEDDGMRMGRVIKLDAEKSTLSQYRRNASHATEYLNASHLNLDKLREVTVRAQEIARVAGSGLNGPAMETYGFEVNQLIEEALNRVNSTHRKRALFAGTETKPNFGSTEVKLGKRFQKTIALSGNYVGSANADGKWEMAQGDKLTFRINGDDYVFTTNAAGVTTETAAKALAGFINSDDVTYANAPMLSTSEYSIHRGARDPKLRDPEIKAEARATANGDLVLVGGVGKDFGVNAVYETKYDPNYYFPQATKAKLDEKARELFNKVPAELSSAEYDKLSQVEKDKVSGLVFNDPWKRDLNVASAKIDGASKAKVVHPTDWKRLSAYDYGDLVRHDGKIWRSRIDANWNHKPGETDVKIWEEVPDGYDVPREDWNLTVSNTERREYWMAPDGKMYDLKSDAEASARTIIIEQGQVATPAELQKEVERLVKRVTLSVANFDAKGSESNAAHVSFDPRNQEYFLGSAGKTGNVVSGVFLKGAFKRDVAPALGNPDEANDAHKPGEVILREGRYYLALQNIGKGQNVAAWQYLTHDFPPDGAVKLEAGKPATLRKGDYLQDQVSGKYYVASKDLAVPSSGISSAMLQLKELVEVTQGSDGTVLLLGEKLPVEGGESTFVRGRPLSLRKGGFIHNPENGQFYVANEDLTLDATQSASFDPTQSTSLKLVSAHITNQGVDWSAGKTYDKGQIVHYNGKYYQALQSNWNNVSFNPDTASEYVVRPSDEYVHDKVTGDKVANNAWLPVEKPLGHVLKFQVEHEEAPIVTFPDAGSGGTTAKARVIVDADGHVAGMQLLDPGRYFTGSSADKQILPPGFETASIKLADGRVMDVKILWRQDASDPGPWKISGFDFGTREMLSGVPVGAAKGDVYSFATGSGTFLERRDADGNVADLAYNGSDKNAEFYVGHESKISSLLDAKKGGTSELGSIVSSLVDLREALRNAKPSAYTEEIEAANQKLISLEEKVVDKMGELSSKMVRLETVQSHDEDYFMEIDRRVARDLDVDVSEAIMRLMRASTAYQASLQVGAQMMNTSLLNFI